MAHYAFLDESNIVVEVIVGPDDAGTDWEAHYAAFRGQQCKQTSYNTHGGVHKLGGTPLRKNYAGIGYTYHADIDAFAAPKPYPSWTLNDQAQWQAPVPMPSDASMEKRYSWDEATTSWVEVQNGS